jgi:site-specific DNA-methyltransferase (adenine-specific)
MTPNQVIHGDCLEVIKSFEDNSVDCIITDPPYGLSFMNKKWDYDVPSIEVFKEMLRVLKQGGTMLCFAGSRTQHRMAINIEDAGFELKDVIMWIYGSGFPKASAIDKLIDKKLGEFENREIVGKNNSNLTNNNILNDDNWNKIGNDINIISEPATPQAQQFKGYKTHSIKPAYEPIIMAIKPNYKNYAENALKYGVSGLNIDECRIPIDKDDKNHRYNLKNKIYDDSEYNYSNVKCGGYMQDNGTQNSLGRFPSNIIFDEESVQVLDEQSGIRKSGALKIKSSDKKIKRNCYGEFKRYEWNRDCSQGGASRFFYVAKASPSERNSKLENLE